ncbi:MAG: DMT family transporter [Candidatus Accumulibacter sp.]|jgi:drug/metabolite transporter (DMT)-like permease|nr:MULTISPECIES: DMT family transporter [unclassified Candidatus Accumulibacter]MQM35046.1 EamA family transporter [Candidatus Accumulibacter phosphatis]MBL8368431.1 DMT family transporter [Accumulibacter sp.]MBN8513884.1 DMT family transporter [Accumulibacter sp.]MBO3704484.1 DMT family transporter [Accumulibacter sp.]HRE69479.1 DMT family transporter [Accumulibacter sp.]
MAVSQAGQAAQVSLAGEGGAPLRLHAALLFLAALLLFAALDATAKHLSAYLAVPLLVWARYLVHLVIMLMVVAPSMGRRLVVTGRPWLMSLRGLTLVAVTLLGQLALKTLPLAETTALIFVAPLLVALLAAPLLGEKVRLRTWLATIAGFVGVLLIARPGGSLFGPGVAYALGAALSYAAYQILTRKLAATEHPMRLLFYTALLGTLAMLPALPVYWDGIWPTPTQSLLIVSLGLYGGIGHFLLIRAFHATSASLLAPLIYTQLVWATLLGWLVFDHFPDFLTVVGMMVIGASGLSLAFRGPR